MKVVGLAITPLDLAPERDAELHAWYEGDHLPENRALHEVTGTAVRAMGQRVREWMTTHD